MSQSNRPLMIVFRVNKHEKEELQRAVQQSGMNQQNYILSKVFSNFMKDSNETVCPQCGGRLILKNGYDGVFLGCENFPSCSYSREVEKEGDL